MPRSKAVVARATNTRENEVATKLATTIANGAASIVEISLSKNRKKTPKIASLRKQLRANFPLPSASSLKKALNQQLRRARMTRRLLEGEARRFAPRKRHRLQTEKKEIQLSTGRDLMII